MQLAYVQLARGAEMRKNKVAIGTCTWQEARTQSDRQRLGIVTLARSRLGSGLGTSLFPVGATESNKNLKFGDLFAVDATK